MLQHSLNDTQIQTLWRVASGAPLAETLEELAHRLQSASPGLRVAFLRAEAQTNAAPCLHVLCAPSMGGEYRNIVAGAVVTPGTPLGDVVLGGCTAFVPRARESRLPPLWRDADAVYLAPITDTQSATLLGVCAFYPAHEGAATPDETALLTLAASLPALAISRDALETDRRRGENALSASLTALRLQTLTDALTGLPNRRQFLQTLTQTISCAESGESACHPAVLFVDLDRFKLINDTMGHAAGDTLLLELSARFTQTVSHDDIVARLGGDEFVILLRHAGERAVRATAKQICTVAAIPVAIGTQEAYVGASVGIAL